MLDPGSRQGSSALEKDITSNHRAMLSLQTSEYAMLVDHQNRLNAGSYFQYDSNRMLLLSSSFVVHGPFLS